MANDVVKKEKNEVVVSGGLSVQTKLLNELEKANEDFGASFTSYGKTCAINCIAGLVMFCKNNGIDLNDIDPTLLRLQVQNVGFTELNYASIPAEIYFDLRKQTIKFTDKETGEVKEKVGYSIAIKPQGAGNEKLVRKYGVGIKKSKDYNGLRNAILIREGDEFIMPQFNGAEMTKPIYKPKLENANNKVIAVMYPVEKTNGEFEYLIATRDSVKANLIAQIRQNALYADEFYEIKEYQGKNKQTYTKRTLDKEKRDAFYAEVDKLASGLSVDEMLQNERLLQYINPTYTSGGSKEAMILRKMKNNALKNYPKEYDNSYVAESVKNMFEEQDKSVLEKKSNIEKVEHDIDEDLNDDSVLDFTAPVDEEETPTEENPQTEQQTEDDIPF